jgi:hypothetical protein
MVPAEEDHLNETINVNNLTTLISEYPSDKSNFSETLTSADKTLIINAVPCKTNGPFPKNSTGRGFSNKFYERTSKAGIKMQRTWLFFSPKLNQCYCQSFQVLKTKCLLVLMIGSI